MDQMLDIPQVKSMESPEANLKENPQADPLESLQANRLECTWVLLMDCLSGDDQMNQQGFSLGISQVEMWENWKEPTKEGFLDFLECTVLCGSTSRICSG